MNKFKVFFFLTLITAPIFGANKFILIREGDPIPKEKFIYCLLDLRTGKLHLGYSKTEAEFDADGKLVGGVRNGGHVELLIQATGLKDPKGSELVAFLESQGPGFTVGGGFVVGKDGKTHLHRAMSNKAAGALSDGRGTINSRLPRVNNSWVALVPEPNAAQLYEAIARRTSLPLQMDFDVFNSQRFVYNKGKHGDSESEKTQYFNYIFRGTREMEKTIHETNKKVFGVEIPKNEKIFLIGDIQYLNDSELVDLLLSMLSPENVQETWSRFLGKQGESPLPSKVRGQLLSELLERGVSPADPNYPKFLEQVIKTSADLLKDGHVGIRRTLTQNLIEKITYLNESQRKEVDAGMLSDLAMLNFSKRYLRKLLNAGLGYKGLDRMLAEGNRDGAGLLLELLSDLPTNERLIALAEKHVAELEDTINRKDWRGRLDRRSREILSFLPDSVYAKAPKLRTLVRSLTSGGRFLNRCNSLLGRIGLLAV